MYLVRIFTLQLVFFCLCFVMYNKSRLIHSEFLFILISSATFNSVTKRDPYGPTPMCSPDDPTKQYTPSISYLKKCNFLCTDNLWTRHVSLQDTDHLLCSSWSIQVLSWIHNFTSIFFFEFINLKETRRHLGVLTFVYGFFRV